MNFYKLELTQDEAVKLYGMFDRPEIAAIVEQALRDKEVAIPPGLGDVLSKAEASGWLRVEGVSITYCNMCKTSYGYHPHKRSNYRKGIQKGNENRNYPVWHPGVDFVTVKGCRVMRLVMEGWRSGICRECWEKLSPLFFSAIIKRELPIDFGTYGEFTSLFDYVDTLICFSCGHETPESEYGKLHALMGGYYPGECPKCGAKQVPFGRDHHKRGYRVARRESRA